MNTLKLSILLFFSITLFSSTNILAQDKKIKAKSFIKLSTKNVGGLAWNWVAENKSEDKAIKFTIKYSKGGAIVTSWTKIFTLEPGDSKHIGRYRDQHTTTINARVKGARFINN
tara:strand:- start:1530 stop:1871 length:342 start_codon:yes stop_codon:yes gene_type:complete